MLCLTRRVDERIVIDGNIEIMVLSIRDGKVRLGISAPKDVIVMRSELIAHHDCDIGGEAGGA